MGKLVNGINHATNALSIDLSFRLFNLQPFLMQIQQLSVPSFFSLLIGLNSSCYQTCTSGNSWTNFMICIASSCSCSITCFLSSSPSLCWWVWLTTCLWIWLSTHILKSLIQCQVSHYNYTHYHFTCASIFSENCEI